MDFQKKMQAAIEIEKLIQRKGIGNSDLIGNIYYFFMNELNQPYSEIEKIPIPLAFKLMRIYEKKRKEEEKQLKKKK